MLKPAALDKIQRAVWNLKNNKAPRSNNILSEMIKYGGQLLLEEMHELLVEI